jgi:hypothetical protein
LQRGDKLEVMSRRRLHADLTAVRALVADGRAELDRATGGVDHIFVTSARERLAELDELLVTATGGLPVAARAALLAAGSFVTVAAVAALATVADLPAVWVIVCSLVAAAIAEVPLRRLTFRLGDVLDRRRVTAVPLSRGPAAGPAVLGGDFVAVPEALVNARVRLVSTALRRVDPRRWRSPYLQRLALDEPVTGRIADADRLLCQAVDLLERFLDERGKEPGP